VSVLYFTCGEEASHHLNQGAGDTSPIYITGVDSKSRYKNRGSVRTFSTDYRLGGGTKRGGGGSIVLVFFFLAVWLGYLKSPEECNKK
jgi:hypothetical protein